MMPPKLSRAEEQSTATAGEVETGDDKRVEGQGYREDGDRCEGGRAARRERTTMRDCTRYGTLSYVLPILANLSQLLK
jgi:hypothetical protein